MEDYTYLWYDVRPHPKFGTVEIRAMDSQTRVEHTLALAALIQAMVKELAEHYEAGEQLTDYPWQMLDENKWLAARHGLDGELVDLPSSERVATRALARRLLDRLRGHAEDLGSADELDGHRGPARARQRRRAPDRGLRGQPRPARGHGRDRRGDGRRARDPTRGVPETIGRACRPSPDLFVVCKNCGSEVSPYITECPYCGHRAAQARAEDRALGPGQAPARRQAAPRGRARRRCPAFARRRDAAALRDARAARRRRCSSSCSWSSSTAAKLGLVAHLSDDPWRAVTSLFVYDNVWYELAALLAIGIFGWRLELRHGPLRSCALFLLGGVGGMAARQRAGLDAVRLRRQRARAGAAVRVGGAGPAAPRARRGARRRPARDAGDRGAALRDVGRHAQASIIAAVTGALAGLVGRPAAGTASLRRP